MEGDDTYSLHMTGVGMCLIELEGVVFALLRNFAQGWSLERGPCTHCNDKFSSRGLAPLQAQRFGIEISFVAETVDTDTRSYRRLNTNSTLYTYQRYLFGDFKLNMEQIIVLHELF